MLSYLGCCLLPHIGVTHKSVPEPPLDWEGNKYKWRDDRFNLWLSHLQFHNVPNFTEVGFGLVDMPASLKLAPCVGALLLHRVGWVWMMIDIQYP